MPTSSTPNPTPTIYTTGPVPTDDLPDGWSSSADEADALDDGTCDETQCAPPPSW